jgi:transposase-like protein
MANRRAPFTAAEEEELKTLIFSKRHTDIELARKFKCSKVTIKIKRTRKYKQLRKKRRNCSDEVKKAITTMYTEDKMKVIDIARRLRLKYWVVWEQLEKSGSRLKLVKKERHAPDREIFNYSEWLKTFLSFLMERLRARNLNSVCEWVCCTETQEQLRKYLREFNESLDNDTFIERGLK